MVPNEQQKEILQILYKRRSAPLQTFDRDDLARHMGKRWHEIQSDVASLEENGYIVTKRSAVGARVFHILSSTSEGVNFIYRDSRRVNVFISSPGDVCEERQIVKSVIEDYNSVPFDAERYILQPLAYEQNAPAAVGKPPQTIVDRYMKKASNSDLFICILWHRMGTQVTHEETGEQFQSGTEYEFVDAYRNNQMHEKPYILLYRGMKPFPPEMDPQQLSAVQDFFKRFEGQNAAFRGLYKRYSSNEEFKKILSEDINIALSKNLIL